MGPPLLCDYLLRPWRVWRCVSHLRQSPHCHSFPPEMYCVARQQLIRSSWRAEAPHLESPENPPFGGPTKALRLWNWFFFGFAFVVKNRKNTIFCWNTFILALKYTNQCQQSELNLNYHGLELVCLYRPINWVKESLDDLLRVPQLFNGSGGPRNQFFDS